MCFLASWWHNSTGGVKVGFLAMEDILPALLGLEQIDGCNEAAAVIKLALEGLNYSRRVKHVEGLPTCQM